MKKTILIGLLTTLCALLPLCSQAYTGLDCDPEANFCVFVQGDPSLKSKITVKTSLSFFINKSSFEYADEAQLAANSIIVAGLPTKFMSDTKIRNLTVKVLSINSQPLSNCQITTQPNNMIQPGFHIVTLSETLENGITQYHCNAQ